MNARGVIVVGSANLDCTLSAPSLPRLGETVLGDDVRFLPGGKGMNQAVASARLGADVVFIGAVGNDLDGTYLLERLGEEKINAEHVHVDRSRRTGLAVVAVLPNGENGIIVAPGANSGLEPGRTAASVRALAGPRSVVVVQAEVPKDVIDSVAHAAEAVGARVLINLAPYTELTESVLCLADPLVVNQVEASALCGSEVDDVGSARAAAESLMHRVRSVVITIGASGACWASGGESGHVASPAVDLVVDTTGAGDAFIGAVAASLSRGEDLNVACGDASQVAAVSVSARGAQASYPTRGEVLQKVSDG